ncbi:hypothetical protein [Rhizomonospora bruguierae]|uniref:hypothetical protein n=1 Tax=Rhizomonospora bruguierae TaxID=1581705 RepID=UPI001BCAB60B|nr:hypothetical protein [Micromonospora sp. NBRC 107566]
MSDQSDGVWRDERRLPLSELDKAVATSAGEGQTDDVTGSDAGAEAAFGHAPGVAGGPAEGGLDLDDEPPTGDRDPDPDTELGRRLRPSTTGRTGPN